MPLFDLQACAEERRPPERRPRKHNAGDSGSLPFEAQQLAGIGFDALHQPPGRGDLTEQLRMPEPMVDDRSRIRSYDRRARRRHSPATYAGRSRPLHPSRRRRTRPAPPPSRTPATSPSETSRAPGAYDVSPSVRPRQAGPQDRQAVERIRQQVRALRSRLHGRSRAVRDDGHPRDSRLRRSPSDPWRRQVASFHSTHAASGQPPPREDPSRPAPSDRDEGCHRLRARDRRARELPCDRT